MLYPKEEKFMSFVQYSIQQMILIQTLLQRILIIILLIITC